MAAELETRIGFLLAAIGAAPVQHPAGNVGELFEPASAWPARP